MNFYDEVRRLPLLGVLTAVALATEAFAECCDYVDPFIGTAGTGHTHPGAACPFGMVQAGPDTGYGSWAYCSGYQHGDASVCGYSQNHLSGTGCPDLGDVQILPFVGELGALPARRAIDKRTEKARPGFYSVVQPDDGLTVEITASRHAAMYRIASRTPGEIRVLVNLPSIIHAEWGRFFTSAADVRPGNDKRSIAGRLVRQGWVTNRPICFSLAFDRAWTSIERLPDVPDDAAPRYVATFSPESGLMVKVGLSMTSAEAAGRNLTAEMPAWDFEGVRRKAEAEWNRLLSRSRAEGDADSLRNWYTALYHLYLQPTDYADVGEEPYFTTLSLWDTYRAAHPWYTVATPEIVAPCVRSMLKVAREEGKLPVMSYGGKYIECMIGNHAIPVIADAYLKGVRGFDAREALMWMTNSVGVVHGKGKTKEDWDVLDRHGYYPFDLVPSESVSRTLECAYDDWCVARFAEAVGEPAVAARFDARARGWRQVVDAASGFARGRDSKGVWRTPFNPFALGGGEERMNDFTEGNAFQWTWSVPQDVPGLVSALGGREAFLGKLDALFEAPVSADGMGERADVTGLIGQYAHGNEPSHHVVYLYSLVGRPDKAAERIREICRRFYRPTPDGLCGNEDCGQMSAWLVFSALGFYPLNPCGGDYVIGAPQLPRVVLSLPGGKTFEMRANGLSDANRYVKSVRLNGRAVGGRTIRHAEILAGGVLEFEMCSDAPRIADKGVCVADDAGGFESVRAECPAQGGRRWYKGMLHCHSYWSDGRAFPEQAAQAYACRGYHFFCLSDHNRQSDDRQYWRDVCADEGPWPKNVHQPIFERYCRDFPDAEVRTKGGKTQVRIKTPAEIKAKFDRPGRFLVLPGMEVTRITQETNWNDRCQVHMNYVNLDRGLPSAQAGYYIQDYGKGISEILGKTYGEVEALAKALGDPPHLFFVNHPHWRFWDVAPQDVLDHPEVRFFEICNNGSDIPLPPDMSPDEFSCDRFWDIVLAHRCRANGNLLYGIGSDDAHWYPDTGTTQECFPFADAYVQVRAAELTPEALLAAMDRGDFYASCGVDLEDVRADAKAGTLSVSVPAKAGVRYTIRFVGTKRDFEAGVVREIAYKGDPTGAIGKRRIPVYSRTIGVTLKTVEGRAGERMEGAYVLQPDDLYVRAVVESSEPASAYGLKSHQHPKRQTAWIQPLRRSGKQVENKNGPTF